MALENKLGITDSTELARTEEKLSKIKAVKLYENDIIKESEIGKFAGLSKIHEFLFGEIYEFAGRVRTVNIAKGNFRFAPVMYLETALKHIDEMPQSTYDEIIEKYVEMNAAKVLLKNALTNQTDNRQMYMKGIDVSYYYEGYNTFKSEDLTI